MDSTWTDGVEIKNSIHPLGGGTKGKAPLFPKALTTISDTYVAMLPLTGRWWVGEGGCCYSIKDRLILGRGHDILLHSLHQHKCKGRR